jgi:hypothetical protein
MGIYSGAGGVKAGAGSKRPPLPVGFYPMLMIEEIREFDGTDPNKPGAHYYAADLEVVSDGAPAPRGTGGTFLTQDAGALASFNLRGIGAIKDFLGCVFGYKEQADRTAKIGEKEILASFAGTGNALAGHIVAAKVTHSTTKNGDTICNFEFSPVFDAQGQPMRIVPGSGRPGASAAPAPAAAPAAPPALPTAPPAVPPPAPAAPIPAGPPPGWERHPDPTWGGAGWFHDPRTPGSQPKQFPGF